MDSIIATKTVNALIPQAELGFGARFFLDLKGGAATGAMLEAAKELMGGLWVGGTLTVHPRTLVFRPNRINQAVHDADYTVTIPLQEVSAVDVRFGFLTKIIDIKTREGTLSIRCFGAKALAAVIRGQMSGPASA